VTCKATLEENGRGGILRQSAPAQTRVCGPGRLHLPNTRLPFVRRKPRCAGTDRRVRPQRCRPGQGGRPLPEHAPVMICPGTFLPPGCTGAARVRIRGVFSQRGVEQDLQLSDMNMCCQQDKEEMTLADERFADVQHWQRKSAHSGVRGYKTEQPLHSLATAASAVQDTTACHLDSGEASRDDSTRHSPRKSRKPLVLSDPHTAFNRQPLSPRPQRPEWTEAAATHAYEPTGRGLLNVKARSEQFCDAPVDAREEQTASEASKASEAAGTVDEETSTQSGQSVSIASPVRSQRSVLNQPTALAFSSPLFSPNVSAPPQFEKEDGLGTQDAIQGMEFRQSLSEGDKKEKLFRAWTTQSPARGPGSSPEVLREEAIRELDEVRFNCLVSWFLATLNAISLCCPTISRCRPVSEASWEAWKS